MRDGNSETETELQAAERRISKIQRCGAARVASMEQSFLGLLEAIGEDPQREGLVRTPGRAARAFEFLTAGYRQSLDGIINNALFESEASEIILVKDIELYSLCEHHLLPFIGKAHVAYIPNGKVVGLSKTARIVDMFARRLQIQENLTMQIADALMKALHPRGVGVVIEAKHLCMMMRGVEKQNSVMKTSCLLGVFKEDARTRSEFLSLLNDYVDDRKTTCQVVSAGWQPCQPSQARCLTSVAPGWQPCQTTQANLLTSNPSCAKTRTVFAESCS